MHVMVLRTNGKQHIGPPEVMFAPWRLNVLLLSLRHFDARTLQTRTHIDRCVRKITENELSFVGFRMKRERGCLSIRLLLVLTVVTMMTTMMMDSPQRWCILSFKKCIFKRIYAHERTYLVSIVYGITMHIVICVNMKYSKHMLYIWPKKSFVI